MYNTTLLQHQLRIRIKAQHHIHLRELNRIHRQLDNHRLDILRSRDTGLHNTLHHHRSSSSSSRWLWSVLEGNSRLLYSMSRRMSDTSSLRASSFGAATVFLDSSPSSWPVSVVTVSSLALLNFIETFSNKKLSKAEGLAQ